MTSLSVLPEWQARTATVTRASASMQHFEISLKARAQGVNDNSQWRKLYGRLRGNAIIMRNASGQRLEHARKFSECQC